MNKRYVVNDGLRNARIFRLIAKSIDLFFVLILSMFFFPVGIILASSYLAFCDSLQNGQSFGKKFMGFSVVSLEDGSACSPKQSAIRNLPFLIPLIFTIVPLWGWIFSGFLLIPLTCLELYLIFKLDTGNRLGDVMADTTVIANDPNRADIRKLKDSWFEEGNSPT